MSIQALQQTAATGIALPGLEVTAVAAAAELERSAMTMEGDCEGVLSPSER